MESSASPSPDPASAAPAPIRPARRKLLRVAVLLFALALLAGAAWRNRVAFLRAAAAPLVLNEPIEPADVVLPLEGDRCLEHAASLYEQGSAGAIALVEPAPNRLERLGALPEFKRARRQALESLGVPPDRIIFLPGQARDAWETARLIGCWLLSNPEAKATILQAEFFTRREREILKRVLPPEAMRRVRIRGVRNRQFGPHDWWRSRHGARGLFSGYVSLACVYLLGPGPADRPEWDADAYEKSLAESAP